MHATGVSSAAWLLLALPLAGAVILLLGGKRTNSWGHLVGVAMPVLAFVLRRSGVLQHAQLPGGRPAQPGPAPVPVDLGRPLQRQHRPAARPAVDLLRAADHRRRLADPHLRRRVHGERPGTPPVLRLHEPVPGRDAAAGAGRQLPRPVRRLGGRGPGLLPADRVLAVQELRGGRRQEGLHRQPGRGRRPVAGDHADVHRVRHGHLHRRVRCPARRPAPGWSPRSACCCCSARAASRPSCRCSPGCWTRWRARPRYRP